MKIKEDKFLSEVFGYSCWNLVVEKGDTINDSTISLFSVLNLKDGGNFVYTTLDKGTSHQVYALTAIGFKAITENILYRIDELPYKGYYLLEDKCEDFLKIENPITEGKELLDIAYHSFTHDRFHIDTDIHKSKANLVKAYWVNNCLAGKRGDSLFISRRGGNIVGFLIALKKRVGDDTVAVIDLIATKQEYRGVGVGGELVSSFLYNYMYQCDYAMVGTQSANIPSRRLYASKGFYPTDINYSLHLHL